jgi:peptide chain release factor 3
MIHDYVPNAEVGRQVARRRTFAIISHPDAGKTTLTEKLLLYGGCLDVAGAVRGRKTQRSATSDWMELERQRGISVSSTVLSFEYAGHQVNLLDTPGHEDFSEDTYRTLMAADCAVMVIDLAKGVESQTEKLFQVCRLRRIPILTFVNKVDRPGRDPLDILTEVEQTLGIPVTPYNWPIGSGIDFRGVYDFATAEAMLFDRGRNGDHATPWQTVSLETAGDDLLPPVIRQKAIEDAELLAGAGAAFDQQAFLAGNLTPVFFGSALNNFGVEPFLKAFLRLSPPPGPRTSDLGRVPVDRPEFSGFVFKIQANLDPRHRDRIAFVRVCSGRFEREMEVLHPRTGKRLKLRRSHRLFAQERETVDEAFPGDVIGLVSPGDFHLGDTICVGEPLRFEPLPQFTPEYFAVLRCSDTSRRKQFERGLEQLVEEGAIQTLVDPDARRREPILAAVGQLQFDVVRFRLETEYNTQTAIEWLPYKLARWLVGDEAGLAKLKLPYQARRAVDRLGQPVVLCQSKWDMDYCTKENPQVRFEPVGGAAAAIGIALPTQPAAVA